MGNRLISKHRDKTKPRNTTGQHDKGGTIHVSMQMFWRLRIYSQYKEWYTYIKWNVRIHVCRTTSNSLYLFRIINS